MRSPSTKLANTIRDLEKRGLLQYDLNGKRYDLHPVVRGIVAGGMRGERTRELGQKVVDHFTAQPHNPWEQAETLEDVASGLQSMRVLLRMQNYQQAIDIYRSGLSTALMFNLHARTDVQALLKAFFPNGWEGDPVPLENDDLSVVLNDAGLALSNISPDQARKLFGRKLTLDMRLSRTTGLVSGLENLAIMAWDAGRTAEFVRLNSLAVEAAEASGLDQLVFSSNLDRFVFSVICGDRATADRLWKKLDAMGRDWARASYRPGYAEQWRAIDLFYRGELTEEFLSSTELLARSGRNRSTIQPLHNVRGEWQLARGKPMLAVESLSEAVRMAREDGGQDSYSEALLVLARYRAGESFDVRGEAEKLSKLGSSGALPVAELWHALGERNYAVQHALSAHARYLNDGEPYVPDISLTAREHS